MCLCTSSQCAFALVGPSGLEPPIKNLSLRYAPRKAAFAFLIEFASRLVLLVGPSGLEPPTSCLSGTRSNLLSYDPMWLVWCFSHLVLRYREQISLLSYRVGIELFSRAASSQVFSPLQSLTSVFGMGTGGPSAFITLTHSVNHYSLNIEQHSFRGKYLYLPFDLRHS